MRLWLNANGCSGALAPILQICMIISTLPRRFEPPDETTSATQLWIGSPLRPPPPSTSTTASTAALHIQRCIRHHRVVRWYQVAAMKVLILCLLFHLDRRQGCSCLCRWRCQPLWWSFWRPQSCRIRWWRKQCWLCRCQAWWAGINVHVYMSHCWRSWRYRGIGSCRGGWYRRSTHTSDLIMVIDLNFPKLQNWNQSQGIWISFPF